MPLIRRLTTTDETAVSNNQICSPGMEEYLDPGEREWRWVCGYKHGGAARA